MYWSLANFVKVNVMKFYFSGIVGAIFPDKMNVAYSLFELGVSVGFVLTFASGIIFSTAVHLWIIFAFIVCAGVSYTVLASSMKYIATNSKEPTDTQMKIMTTESSNVVIQPGEKQI